MSQVYKWARCCFFLLAMWARSKWARLLFLQLLLGKWARSEWPVYLFSNCLVSGPAPVRSEWVRFSLLFLLGILGQVSVDQVVGQVFSLFLLAVWAKSLKSLSGPG